MTVAEIDAIEAFEALRAMLQGRPRGDWTAPERPALDRLRRALADTTGRSLLDLAVLLRQALVHETARRQGAPASVVLGPGCPLVAFEGWSRVGLIARPLGDGLQVEAIPWRPNWLPSPPQGVEALAAEERPLRFGLGVTVAGDPFLASVGHVSYQTRGQRAAVRAALATPPGGALAVGLATGEGKSLIFQLAARTGFVGAGAERGLVLVITPTVALAIDHENAAIEIGFAGPLAYRGGDKANNATLRARMEEDGQGLCIASPEAVCGPLLATLRRVAERGRLRAIVIDEAHLVDGWGTGFRTEFQTLSGVRSELVALGPPEAAARTLLLSATLTPATIQMLKVLFSGPGPFQSISAIRLRAEPDYWVAPQVPSAGRDAQISEALHRAPRPAVLYVSRVQDAEAWRQRLLNEGFANVRMVHGRTSGAERETILAAWRAGDVDLVVGTSAFGLGIDYRHVRTVLHACVPETLDRFYQEVGRGGRDGRSFLSLIAPADGDLGTAERINRQVIIGVDRGLQRWSSMFSAGVAQADDAFVVPLDVAPSAEPEDIDMEGERNTDWNARVLTLMARAGLIRMLGSLSPDEDRAGPRERVKILDFGHLTRRVWDQKVEPMRAILARGAGQSLDLMTRFLAGGDCPGRLFRELYQAGAEAHVCSHCQICRTDPSRRTPERPSYEPDSPWPPQGLNDGRLARALDTGRRNLAVFYDPTVRQITFRRRFGQMLAALMAEGVNNLVLVGDQPGLLEEARSLAATQPLFVAVVEQLSRRRLPKGPELVVYAPQVAVDPADLQPRQAGGERVMLLPTTMADPGRPQGLLRQTYGGRSLPFERFHARMSA